MHLSGNLLHGEIPKVLPKGLQLFDLSNNQLTGGIPDVWPNTLTDFHVNGIQIIGSIPVIPNSLIKLHLGFQNSLGNQFTGTLQFNMLHDLHINHNNISSIRYRSLIRIKFCDLSGNPLAGFNDHYLLSVCTAICRTTAIDNH